MESKVDEQFTDPLRGWRGIAILLVGLLSIEFVLFWPSFCGERILAPTDVLSTIGPFSQSNAADKDFPSNAMFSDTLEQFYPWLQFAARELHQGRLPLWNPNTYCGTPFLANNQSGIFCPFNWLYFAWPNPHILVWMQLAKAMTGSLGAFLFFRLLGVRSLAALFGGWTFPFSGFAMLWLFHPQSAAFAFLPWAFWSVERVLQTPRSSSGVALAIVLALNLLSGHLETTAHILFAAALYGVLRLICSRWSAFEPVSNAKRIILIACCSATLGFGIGAIQLLPTMDYLKSSRRMQLRAAGKSGEDLERSNWEIVRIGFPMLFGNKQEHMFERTAININESGANAYVGFLTAAVLAPLGLFFRDRFGTRWIWVVMGLFFAAPLFGIPILTHWHKVPPFDAMRGPRAVLVTGWCILCLATLGLEKILSQQKLPRRFLIGVAILLGLLLLRFRSIAMRIIVGAVDDIPAGYWIGFQKLYWLAVGVCIAGICLCVLLMLFSRRRTVLAGLILLCIAGEMIGTFWRYHPQKMAKSYYPVEPWIGTMLTAQPDYRFVGLGWFLTPEISTYFGLHDIRGYDGVDPLPMTELLEGLNTATSAPYAKLLYFTAAPSPILDMLAVRDVHQVGRGNGQWVTARVGKNIFYSSVNPNSLKRAYVPTNVKSVANKEERVALLRSPSFKPAELAVVTETLSAPIQATKGTVSFVKDDPCEVVLEAKMETAGLVVLADSWNKDWHVTVDEKSAEALQANHALRGVVVPAGEHVIRWTYEPAAFYLGRRLAYCSIVLLIAWSILGFAGQRRKSEISE